MKQIITSIVLILAGIGMGGVMFLALGSAVRHNDQNTCLKLREQAVTYKYADFYITHDEKVMCDYLNLSVEAPVK